MSGRPGLPPGILPSNHLQRHHSKSKLLIKSEVTEVINISNPTQMDSMQQVSPAPHEAEVSAFAMINATLASNDELVRVLKAQALDRSACLDNLKRSSSFNKTPRTGLVQTASLATTPRLPMLMTQQPPQPVFDFPERLSVRMAPLALAAELVSQMVESRRGAGGALLKLTCKNFVVGRLSCFNASVLDVCGDRFEYNFNHAKQDIDYASLDIKKLTFVYHIAGPMKAVFAGAYDHKNKTHLLSWAFCSSIDAAAFQQQIAAAGLPMAASKNASVI